MKNREIFPLRLSVNEKQLLIAAQKKLNYSSLAEYIRHVIINHAADTLTRRLIITQPATKPED